MSDIAVRTVGLGKLYQIGAERAQDRTLRDTIAHAVKRPIERIRHPGAATHVSDTLWALKDINLEIPRGEVLGVIGRNGSGKSTLLKVLSHITEPTEGYAEIKGRVASLLEVGTGFHAELSGRENILLNGAILGMTRAEIKAKFDEIVEFSEIGKFLDTPVKRYSSGMYVRLAFAVAASLEPEILIVDEVLAVGDAEFQRKCVGKMEQVATTGRTVVFVSHNMAAVRSLCTRAALLDAGRQVAVGAVSEICDRYIESGGTSGVVFSIQDKRGRSDADAVVTITEARVVDVAQDDDALTSLAAEIDCTGVEGTRFNFEWRLVTATGQPLVFGAPEIFRRAHLDAPGTPFRVLLTIRDVPLAAGRYRLEIAATQAFRRVLDTVHVQFEVEHCDPWRGGFNFAYETNWAATFAADEVTIADMPADEGA